MLINKRKGVDLKHYNDSKAVTEYFNDTDYIYKSIGEYNPNRERKISIVSCDMIADVPSNINSNRIIY